MKVKSKEFYQKLGKASKRRGFVEVRVYISNYELKSIISKKEGAILYSKEHSVFRDIPVTIILPNKNDK